MKVLKIVFLFWMIIFGCSKDKGDTAFDDVNIPENKKIDFNEDGVIDYFIRYQKTNIDELPREVDLDTLTYDRSVTCQIGIGINSIIHLYRPDPLIWKLPPLSVGDTLFSNPIDSKYWSHVEVPNIMIIRRHNDSGIWEENWTNLTDEPLYFGLKTKIDSDEELCWVKLKLNSITGEVNHIKHECTTADRIIITD